MGGGPSHISLSKEDIYMSKKEKEAYYAALVAQLVRKEYITAMLQAGNG
jgi:hypothetical protein